MTAALRTTERRAARTHAGLSEYPASPSATVPGGHVSPGSLFAWELRQEIERVKQCRDAAPRWARAGWQRRLEGLVNEALVRGL